MRKRATTTNVGARGHRNALRIGVASIVLAVVGAVADESDPGCGEWVPGACCQYAQLNIQICKDGTSCATTREAGGMYPVTVWKEPTPRFGKRIVSVSITPGWCVYQIRSCHPTLGMCVEGALIRVDCLEPVTEWCGH